MNENELNNNTRVFDFTEEVVAEPEQEIFKTETPVSEIITAETEKERKKRIKAENKARKAQAKAAKKANKKKPGFVIRALRATAAAVLIGAVAGASFYGTVYTGFVKFPAPATQIVIENATKAAQLSSVDTTVTHIENSGVADVAAAVLPSVVAISGTVTYTANSYYFFYYGNMEQKSPVSGSGIILGANESELLIVTNAHVVDGVDNLKVTFVDNTSVDAVIKGMKSDSDLAVVAVPLEQISSDTISKIAYANIGNSDEVKVGETAIAIGNSYGYGISVTQGIVSATGKSLTVDNVVYSNLIQTDAAINPGNSGGALVNAKGELIGINSVKLSDTKVEGMGYAISITSVEDVIEELKVQETRSVKYSDEERGYLGIRGASVTSEYSSAFGMPVGVYVKTVTENSAAEKAGIVTGDIITGFDGKTVDSWDTLINLMNYYGYGEKVDVTFMRVEGNEYAEHTVCVELTRRPAQ